MTPIISLFLVATTPACADSSAKIAAATIEGDPAARSAAQRGLDFLASAAQSWQGEHQCYGCHVQGVTLEAMTVGRAHQYRVRDSDLDAIVKGMLDLPVACTNKRASRTPAVSCRSPRRDSAARRSRTTTSASGLDCDKS